MRQNQFLNADHNRRIGRWLGLFSALTGAAVLGGSLWTHLSETPPTALTTSAYSVQSSLSLDGLTRLPAKEFATIDIATMNLLAAGGLNGSKSNDVPGLLAELDRMVDHVKTETKRHLPRFHRTPHEFNDSEAYFKMLCLVTVLQQDFGIRYNPQRAQPADGRVEPNESFYADASDVFLHGLLGPKHSGTCASLPVLYVAVGRRLGYPLKLVTAKNHLFVRWENQRERLNIEATTEGLTTFEDEYYRQWPFPMSPDEESEEQYLVSLKSRDELAVFLSQRTHCLVAMGKITEALANQRRVCELFPHSALHKQFLKHLEDQYGRVMAAVQ